MQAALADQRAAEAAIEKQRAFHNDQSERVSAVQGRYYEVGADISRMEQTIQHSRELRDRQRSDLAKAHSTLSDLAAHIERDERQLETVREEIARLEPEVEGVQHAETAAAEALETAELALQDWQQRWEQFNRSLGSADQTTQVERAVSNSWRTSCAGSPRRGIGWRWSATHWRRRNPTSSWLPCRSREFVARAASEEAFQGSQRCHRAGPDTTHRAIRGRETPRNRTG